METHNSYFSNEAMQQCEPSSPALNQGKSYKPFGAPNQSFIQIQAPCKGLAAAPDNALQLEQVLASDDSQQQLQQQSPLTSDWFSDVAADHPGNGACWASAATVLQDDNLPNRDDEQQHTDSSVLTETGSVLSPNKSDPDDGCVDAGVSRMVEEEEEAFQVPKVLWSQEMTNLYQKQRAMYKRYCKKKDPKLKEDSSRLKSQFRFHYKKLKEEMMQREDFEELKQVAKAELEQHLKERDERVNKQREEHKARIAKEAEQCRKQQQQEHSRNRGERVPPYTGPLPTGPPRYGRELITESFRRQAASQVMNQIFMNCNTPFSNFSGLRNVVRGASYPEDQARDRGPPLNGRYLADQRGSWNCPPTLRNNQPPRRPQVFNHYDGYDTHDCWFDDSYDMHHNQPNGNPRYWSDNRYDPRLHMRNGPDNRHPLLPHRSIYYQNSNFPLNRADTWQMERPMSRSVWKGGYPVHHEVSGPPGSDGVGLNSGRSKYCRVFKPKKQQAQRSENQNKSKLQAKQRKTRARKLRREQLKAGAAAVASDEGPSVAGDGGSAVAGDIGSAVAGDIGSAVASDGGPAVAGDGGPAVAGDGGSAVAGDGDPAVAGDGGPAVAGDGGPAVAGDGGPAVAGDGGPAVADEGATVSEKTSSGVDPVTDFAADVVNGANDVCANEKKNRLAADSSTAVIACAAATTASDLTNGGDHAAVAAAPASSISMTSDEKTASIDECSASIDEMDELSVRCAAVQLQEQPGGEGVMKGGAGEGGEAVKAGEGAEADNEGEAAKGAKAGEADTSLAPQTTKSKKKNKKKKGTRN